MPDVVGTPADPACDSEVVGEGAPVVARKDSSAVRETTLIVVLPGVPAADDDGRAIMSGDVLCRRRVSAKERQMRRVHEQEGGSIRVPGVPVPAMREDLFIERTTPQAPTKPNTRKPARLAIV